MELRKFFSGWVWMAITGTASLLSLIGVRMDIMLDYINKLSPKDVIEFVLLVIAIVSFAVAIIIKSKKPDIAKNVLKDIAMSKKPLIKNGALWEYGKNSGGLHLGETWQSLINGLVVTTERPDLDYHNFGNEFHFIDLSTAKEIPIPTGNKPRTEKVGATIRIGMILRLMSKDA